MSVEKLVIIGSGPAGLAASIYAARAALKPLCIEGYNAGGLIPGGQLMFTTDVENYPGFEKIHGPALMKAMRDQASKLGTRLVTEDVVQVDLGRKPFTITTDEHSFDTLAIVVATGAAANWLGLPNEKRLAESGGGVSACAVCDGALPQYRDQEIAVVGGGDSAIEEGSYLTKFAKKVHLVHRRDKLRASKAMQERFFRLVGENKMEPVWNSAVVDVLGDRSISGLRLMDIHTRQERELPVKGLFVAIGHTPNSAFLAGQVLTDAKGYIKLAGHTATHQTQTSVEGVFAAGDVADHVYRQAVTAAGTGCMAALDAARWLAEQGIE